MRKKHIKWDFTGQCNLRCCHCSVGTTYFDQPQDELSQTEKRIVIDKLAEGGVASISFLGGEPLVHGDEFFDIARYAATKDIRTTLVSNGVLMNKDMVAKILDAGIDQVVVSMEGSTSAAHDPIRGAGTFETVDANLHTLLEAKTACGHGPAVKINTVLSQVNMRDISSMFHRLARMGIDEWALLSLGPVGYASNRIEQLVLSPEEEIDAALILAREWTAVMDAPPFRLIPQFVYPLVADMIKAQEGLSLPPPAICCTAAMTMGFLTPDGLLYPCDRIASPHYSGRQIGQAFIRPFSLLDREFYDIWNEAYFMDLFPFITDPRTYRLYTPCNRCKYLFRRTCNPCPLYALDTTVTISTCQMAAEYLGNISGGYSPTELGIGFVTAENARHSHSSPEAIVTVYQNKTVRRRRGIRSYVNDGQLILFNPYDVAFIGLNEAGRYIWGLIARENSGDTIFRELLKVIKMMKRDHGMSEAISRDTGRQVRHTIDDFLSRLESHGFIESCDGVVQ